VTGGDHGLSSKQWNRELFSVNQPTTHRAGKMDIVYIRELQVETIIGIFDWEREVKQVVSLDVEMQADIRQSAQTDDIEDTLNYKAVAKRLISFIEDSEFQLVETLAEQCAVIILQEFDVPWVRLRLSKPGAIRGARDVGVIIERGERR
jgi:dihydroneopterin aldolase